MEAITQFVPVWSGTQLYSRRLSTAQLWLVALGLLGFAGSLIAGEFAWLAVFGALLLIGFWTFVYNVGRTLLALPAYDVTERHFALALGFLFLVTTFGLALAIGFTVPLFPSLGVTRANVVGAHATLAGFGVVVTTILGALYQLGTMFTQTDLHGIDAPLRRLEEVGYPVGVVCLAGGRLLDSTLLARTGGVLIVVALAGSGGVLGRRLYETRVEWTPMLSRYAVAVLGIELWAVLTFPAWIEAPLARETTFGTPVTVHLLLLGVVGFVVLGTLYHVVPFIVWVHRYSNRLGYEAVPMIDDLYNDRIATVDFWLLFGGTVVLVAGDLSVLPSTTSALGGALVLVGTGVFLANALWAIRTHSPYSLLGVLFHTVAIEGSATEGSTSERSLRRTTRPTAASPEKRRSVNVMGCTNANR